MVRRKGNSRFKAVRRKGRKVYVLRNAKRRRVTRTKRRRR